VNEAGRKDHIYITFSEEAHLWRQAVDVQLPEAGEGLRKFGVLMPANKYRLSFWGDENTLNLDCGDRCRAP